jgi:ribosomal-protein-serine acetyltransferase
MPKQFSIPVDEELVLKILTPKHAKGIFDLVDRNRTLLRQFLPWVDHNLTVEDSKKFIKERLRLFKKDLGFSLCIFYQDKMVGTIGLHYIDKSDFKTEMGYWLSEDQQGKGIMHRSCFALIDYCFNTLKLHRVEIRCAANNTASQRVAQKLSFKQEGILREAAYHNKAFYDIIVYSMLADEFKAFKEYEKKDKKKSSA